MVIVLRQSGFSVMIYTRDHEPMHAHVWYQGGEAIVRFETKVRLIEVNGLNRRDARLAEAIVEENRDFLIG